jgi:hypothetical protein
MAEIISYGGNMPTGATYHSNPELTNQLSSALGGVAGQAAGNYFPLLQNVTQNPLYQSQLQGLLQSLQPSEQRATTGLQDLFRSSGMTNSGAFAQQAGNLQRDILNNRTQAAGKLAGDSFNSLVAALNGPLSQASPLINALKLQQESKYIPPSVSGSTYGSGSGGGSFLDGTSAFNSNNDPYFQNALANSRAQQAGYGGGGTPQRSSSPQPSYYSGGNIPPPQQTVDNGYSQYGQIDPNEQYFQGTADMGYYGNLDYWGNPIYDSNQGMATIDGGQYYDPNQMPSDYNYNPNPVINDNSDYTFSDQAYNWFQPEY